MEAMGCLWGLAGVAVWLALSALSLGLGVYALFAYVLYRVGRKFRRDSYPRYLIPVYNLILLCRCADLPGAYVVLLLAPGTVALAGVLLGILLTGPFAGVALLPLLHPLAWLVAAGAHTVLWGRIAQRLGKDFWLWGILVAFFWLPLLVLAFDDSLPAGREGGGYLTAPPAPPGRSRRDDPPEGRP